MFSKIKSICSLAFLALFSLSTNVASAKEKVILDTDMVELFDDGVAMMMLAKSPNIDLLGVTTVTGNSWAEQGAAYAVKQLNLVGKDDIPVVLGNHMPIKPHRYALIKDEVFHIGKGNDPWYGALAFPEEKDWKNFYKNKYNEDPVRDLKTEHAVNFIIDTVRANPNEVTLVVIGPCTNLALAVTMAPDIVGLIKQVIYMGGAFFTLGNVTPAAEVNWWIDPEAAKICLNSAFKKQTIFSLDSTEKAIFETNNYNRFLKTLNEVNKPLAELLKQTFLGQQFQKNKDFRFFVWDAIVGAYMINSDVVTKAEEYKVDIDTNEGLSIGKSYAYKKPAFSDNAEKNIQDYAPPFTQDATIVRDINLDLFWNIINDKNLWKK